MRDTDRRIARVAAEHLSLITSRQLLDIGVTRDERDSRVERRLLVPVHPGVYRMPWVPPSYKRDVLAGCLPGHRRGCVLSVSRAVPVLVRSLSDLGRRPGRERLKELVELQIEGVRPTDSWLEDRVLEFLRSLGLPEPVRQHPLQLGNGRRIRFDLAYPDRQTAIEADSRLWHSTPADRRKDAERDRAAAALGWTTVRITWLDLEERPGEVARRLGARAEAA